MRTGAVAFIDTILPRFEDRVLVSWKIRSGKIVRTEVLGFGRDEVQTALEAAGLQE
jgi:hypothetical protein